MGQPVQGRPRQPLAAQHLLPNPGPSPRRVPGEMNPASRSPPGPDAVAGGRPQRSGISMSWAKDILAPDGPGPDPIEGQDARDFLLIFPPGPGRRIHNRGEVGGFCTRFQLLTKSRCLFPENSALVCRRSFEKGLEIESDHRCGGWVRRAVFASKSRENEAEIGGKPRSTALRSHWASRGNRESELNSVGKSEPTPGSPKVINARSRDPRKH
jgi:hypothetical protein